MCLLEYSERIIKLFYHTKRNFSKVYTKGVPRLDGSRSKKQVSRPQVRTRGLSVAMYCIDEITCDIVGNFSAPAVIQRTHINSAPGELCPPFPLLLKSPVYTTKRHCSIPWN